MDPVKIDTAAMPKIEIRLLCSTFLEQIKAFYEAPEHAAWKSLREQGEERQT